MALCTIVSNLNYLTHMRQFGHKQTLHVFSLSGDVGSGKHSKHSNLNYNATTQGPDENVVVLICQSCCKNFLPSTKPNQVEVWPRCWSLLKFMLLMLNWLFCLSKKTLPKALRTQVLTSNFGLVGLVQYARSELRFVATVTTDGRVKCVPTV